MADRRWTAAQETVLRRMFLAAPVREIAKVLGFAPSVVYRRIAELKLAESSPLETLPDAARRHGITVAKLELVLLRAGIALHASLANRRRGTRVVLRAEVDRAVARRSPEERANLTPFPMPEAP